MTPAELAERDRTGEPYAREWLNAQAAGGYRRVRRPPTAPVHPARRARGRARPTRAARPSCPASSRSRWAPCTTPTHPRRRPATATGWAGTSTTPTCTTAASGSSARCTTATWWPSGCPRSTAWWTSWSAARTVADVGCGHGASTILMAQAFPRSRSSAPTTTRPRSSAARERAAAAGRRDRVDVRGRPGDRVHRHGVRPGRRRSTPCTTWATRWARPGTCTRRSPPTAPGWSSSRWPATASRTTSTRSAGRTTGSPPCCARRRRCPRTSGWRSARRPVRRGSATSPSAAGFTGFRLAASTPFNNVFEVRP